MKFVLSGGEEDPLKLIPVNIDRLVSGSDFIAYVPARLVPEEGGERIAIIDINSNAPPKDVDDARDKVPTDDRTLPPKDSDDARDNPATSDEKTLPPKDSDDARDNPATDDNNLPPKVNKLYQNHPNPFNPITEIRFDLFEAEYVHLAIYDINGQRVATLVNGYKNEGRHRVIWNGTTSNGLRVSSGIYLYVIKAGNFVESRKMVLFR